MLCCERDYLECIQVLTSSPNIDMNLLDSSNVISSNLVKIELITN